MAVAAEPMLMFITSPMISASISVRLIELLKFVIVSGPFLSQKFLV